MEKSKMVVSKIKNKLGRDIHAEKFTEKSRVEAVGFITNSVAINSMLEAGAQAKALVENSRIAYEIDNKAVDINDFTSATSRFSEMTDVLDEGMRALEDEKQYRDFLRNAEKSKAAKEEEAKQRTDETSKVGDKA